MLCVGVSDKFSGNMETHEFITTKLIRKGEFFYCNFFKRKINLSNY